MEPRIQYARTADGVSIAYWTMGEGPALVQMWSIPFCHSQLEWQIPEIAHLLQRLARNRTLVGFDCRGTGLSERNVTDFSLDALVRDLEAVVDHLGLASFALGAVANSGPVAVAYAARHPERVSHLLLWCSWAGGAEALQRGAMFELLETDWELYTETSAHIALGWSQGEQAHRFAALMRECIAQEPAVSFHRALADIDVSAQLPHVRSPTLVLYRREVRWPELALSRELASGIPNARLAVLEGDSLAPYLGDTDAMLRAMDEFLGDGTATVEAAETPAPSGLVTILFTDLASSTALTQRLGDAKAQELVRAHNTIVREALAAHGGSEIKHTGDGIMASFPTASGALECAIAIQRAVEAQGVGAHGHAPLQVHIGLNAGEPIAEESDLFGTSVQLARRICDHAEAGQILASNVVRELAAGKGFLFADVGDVVPKVFDEAVRLYEVRWRDS